MTGMTVIPPNYVGPEYKKVLADLSEKRTTKRYLEIGVSTGELLKQIRSEVAVGVDPSFQLSENVTANKIKVFLHKTTSDAFFANPAGPAEFGGPVDLAFLDGMHTFEFLLRDFYNTEKLCSPEGLIGMHDCLPLNAEMTPPRDAEHSIGIGRGTDHPDYWTGDVWKIVPILKKYRPDLRIVCVSAPPTGIVFVTNLDPISTVLKDNYIKIIDEFASIPNDREHIEALYADITLVSGQAIMHEFDHSLYFRC